MRACHDDMFNFRFRVHFLGKYPVGVLKRGFVESTKLCQQRIMDKWTTKKRKLIDDSSTYDDKPKKYMKLTPAEKLAKYKGDKKEDFEYFFRQKSAFSQFHPAEFIVDNVKYVCAEQYMMHQKALVFKDKEIAEQIMKSTKPLDMKKLGRKVCNFVPEKWSSMSVDIVKKGNIAKFSQNKELKAKLLATHPKILVEASPRDCLWGIGLSKENEKAWNRGTWRGKNLLGYALTDVRKELMDQTSCCVL